MASVVAAGLPPDPSVPTAARDVPAAAPVAARVQDARKVYGSGETGVAALDGVTVGFDAGAFTAIMGPSGSGKSTLLHCLAGLDTLTSGQAFIGTSDLATLTDTQRTILRRDRLGFIFQAFNLIAPLTAAENITLPADLARRKIDPDWLSTIVTTLGLTDRLHHRPAQLSGGQQQRVAIARALAGRPEVVFADEPTGALDTRASASLLTFLRSAVDTLGQTVVMVTHDPVAAGYADRVVFLVDGRVAEVMDSPTDASVLTTMTRLGR